MERSGFSFKNYRTSYCSSVITVAANVWPRRVNPLPLSRVSRSFPARSIPFVSRGFPLPSTLFSHIRRSVTRVHRNKPTETSIFSPFLYLRFAMPRHHFPFIRVHFISEFRGNCVRQAYWSVVSAWTQWSVQVQSPSRVTGLLLMNSLHQHISAIIMIINSKTMWLIIRNLAANNNQLCET